MRSEFDMINEFDKFDRVDDEYLILAVSKEHVINMDIDEPYEDFKGVGLIEKTIPSIKRIIKPGHVMRIYNSMLGVYNGIIHLLHINNSLDDVTISMHFPLQGSDLVFVYKLVFHGALAYLQPALDPESWDIVLEAEDDNKYL